MRRSRGYCESRVESPCLWQGSIWAVIVSGSVLVCLLLLISIIEWILPSLPQETMRYIATVIPPFSLLVGTGIAARRMRRAGLYLGIIGGACAVIIAFFVAWCIGTECTLLWLGYMSGICFGGAILGGLIGNLCAR